MRRLHYRVKLKYLLLITVAVVTLKVCGIFTLFFEEDFDAGFKHYPYDGDIEESVHSLRNNLPPPVQPINRYDYAFVHEARNKCRPVEQQIRIVYLIKSDPEHYQRREAIRATWGFQRRFSDVEIRTVFLLGRREHGRFADLQQLIDLEAKRYDDIVQADFADTYNNVTIKTMTGLRWAVERCGDAKFYMFVDDDYYVSTKNVLRFLRHPTGYPKFLQEAVSNVLIKKRQVVDFELPDDVRLYAGYTFHSKPLRHYFTKWHISLDEYPYDRWPPYITAGAYILSHEALHVMYYTSFYVKHFRFDDVYLGMLALRANIEPFHSDEFYYYKRDYTRSAYTFTVASHGFDDPMDLLTVWNEQKSLGNA